MQKILIALAVVVVAGLGAYFFLHSSSQNAVVPDADNTTATTTPGTTQATTTPALGEAVSIGTSVQGNSIDAYHFGTGDKELLFVGGIHGGYEWNTVLLAFDLIDYLKEHPEAVPENEKVTVIPVLNPDGLKETVGTTGRFSPEDVPAAAQTVAGRFNANTVDLNRNFDCDWQASGTWQNKTVSGGSKAFSEPESQAMRAYIAANTPAAAVVWYSSAGGAYASSCHNGVLPETSAILKTYSAASKYPAHADFDFYEVTGDMVNWLAKQNIPAISVLLTTHDDPEWEKNKAGIEALLASYAE